MEHHSTAAVQPSRENEPKPLILVQFWTPEGRQQHVDMCTETQNLDKMEERGALEKRVWLWMTSLADNGVEAYHGGGRGRKRLENHNIRNDRC